MLQVFLLVGFQLGFQLEVFLQLVGLLNLPFPVQLVLLQFRILIGQLLIVLLFLLQVNLINNIFYLLLERSNYVYHKLNKMIGHLPKVQIQMISHFILNNKSFYYDLSNIYSKLSTNKLVDCSSSIFISKCHLLFMENYIDMVQFLIKFRKYNIKLS